VFCDNMEIFEKERSCSMRIRIECNITQRCNARCLHCNKAVGYADHLFPDMTVEQIRTAVDMLIDQKITVRRFTFCGGEPILNKGLQDMIYEVARLPGLHMGRVLSNDLNASKSLRDKIVLPDDRFRWVLAPLDDPDDPLSGKNDPTKRGNTRTHQPFWISPHDLGMEANFEKCNVRGWCGIGLDSTGFSMCGKAFMFGELFGIETSKWDIDIKKHIKTAIPDICKHCQYGLGGVKGLKRKGPQHDIDRRYKAGELNDISPTFEKAFSDHAEKLKNLVPLQVSAAKAG